MDDFLHVTVHIVNKFEEEKEIDVSLIKALKL